MITKFVVPANTIKETTTIFYKVGENNNFPLAFIGRDSYICDSTILTGMDFTISNGYGIHNLQFGKFVSGASGLEFCMGINHNYLNLTTSASELFNNNSEAIIGNKYKNKGQILIQNDVWLGTNVTVMPGVTIHNGAVVAANSHVVKDVEPYAIVGGNPAKLIKYRFNKEIIDKLLTIQWWNWNDEKIRNNNQFFYNGDIKAFCDKYYDEAFEEKQNLKKFEITQLKHTYLFFSDFTEPYPLWKLVVKGFIAEFKNQDDCLLLLYINEKTNQEVIDNCNKYIDETLEGEKAKCSVNVCIDTKENERAIFKNVNYFIANRSKDTILHSCYADENNVKIISGVDYPIF